MRFCGSLATPNSEAWLSGGEGEDVQDGKQISFRDEVVRIHGAKIKPRSESADAWGGREAYTPCCVSPSS